MFGVGDHVLDQHSEDEQRPKTKYAQQPTGSKVHDPKRIRPPVLLVMAGPFAVTLLLVGGLDAERQGIDKSP